MKRFVVPLIPALLSVLHASEQTAPRTWTDRNGRTVEAELLEKRDNEIVLRTTGGQELTVPIANLSSQDQNFVKKAPVKDIAGRLYDGPPAEDDWPRIVTLNGSPEVTVVKEDADAREFIYQTDRYEFISDSKLGAPAVREFSRAFEATWKVNCLLPLDLRPTPEGDRTRFRAKIFTDYKDYVDAGGVPYSAGVYIGKLQALMVPLVSLGVRKVGDRVTIDFQAEDYETLIHEITHQMMNHWLPKLPLWLSEGAAEYVALADYDNGRFSFLRIDDRLEEQLDRTWSGGSFMMLPLERLMSFDRATWFREMGQGGANRNYDSALALTYYFYHLDDRGDGAHIRKLYRAIAEAGEDANTEALIDEHLVRGRSYQDLEEEIRRAFRQKGIKVDFPEAPGG